MLFKKKKIKKNAHGTVSQQTAISQLEYIFKFGALVHRFGDAFKYLHLDRDVEDLKLFVMEFSLIKKEFERLDPDIFQYPMTNDLFLCIKSSHSLFKEMLDNGGKISECIEAYFRTREIENLKYLELGVKKAIELSGEMCKLLKILDKTYAKLNKGVEINAGW